MNEQRKPRRGAGFIAFVLGVIIGRSGLKFISHIIYLTAILLVFLFGQVGPINTYITEQAKVDVGEYEIKQAVDKAVPELKNMKTIANQLSRANKILTKRLEALGVSCTQTESKVAELKKENDKVTAFYNSCVNTK